MIREKIELFRKFIELEFADRDIVKIEVIKSPKMDVVLRNCVLCGEFLGDLQPIVRVTAVRKDYWDLRFKIRAWDRNYRKMDSRRLFTHTYYFHLKCFIMGFGNKYYREIHKALRDIYPYNAKEIQLFYVWSKRYGEK